MPSPERIRVGARVEILEPAYVAGEIGIVLGQEELIDKGVTDYWIIKVEATDIVLSLSPAEFRVLDLS